MHDTHDADMPIWAASKSKKQIDILKEVAKTLAEDERVRASRPIAKLTESELVVEQGRLEELLESDDMTVEEFRRLQEVDYFLEAMNERRRHDSAHEGWRRESFME